MHELYSSDIIYRPPPEADSILLEAAVGCSWGKCTFCPEALGPPFGCIPLERVEENAARLAAMPENQGRKALFLAGSNTFVLSAARLAEVFDVIRRRLPQVERVSMYARTGDVLAKTEQELSDLKARGLGTLYIGLESGSDRILERVCKGADAAQMAEAFERLDFLDIPYGLSLILGLGGQEDCMEHVERTAAVCNACHPNSIRVMSLTLQPGTVLHQQAQEGKFHPLSPGDILMEEWALLHQLTVQNCLFIGTHATNNVPIAGFLPQHKDALLAILSTAIRNTNLDTLEGKSCDVM